MNKGERIFVHHPNTSKEINRDFFAIVEDVTEKFVIVKDQDNRVRRLNKKGFKFDELEKMQTKEEPKAEEVKEPIKEEKPKEESKKSGRPKKPESVQAE